MSRVCHEIDHDCVMAICDCEGICAASSRFLDGLLAGDRVSRCTTLQPFLQNFMPLQGVFPSGKA